MPKRFLTLFAGILWLALCSTSPVRAEPPPSPLPAPISWQVNADHSHCDFSLHALRWFKVSGRFARIEGAVQAVAEGHLATIRVPIDSVQMASEGRRKWALSDEFFDAARFPELRFEARLDGIDRDSLRRPIQGIMELRGIRGAVTLQVEAVDCSSGNLRCEVTASGQVSRRQFGMTSQRMLLGDHVQLRMHLVLVQLAADDAPASGR